MNTDYYINRLELSAPLVIAMIQDMSAEQLRWRPGPDAWSALEVLCHLYDEECEDFRVRIDYTLHRPGEALPKIDPQGWVMERHYQDRNPEEVLEAWLTERRRSIEWLRGLNTPAWGLRCSDPHLHDLRAGDFLTAWAGHDLLHLRQLAELQWAYQAFQGEFFSPIFFQIKVV